MSYFHFDSQEKHDFLSSAAVLECANCETTVGPIETYMTDDGKQLRLCGDCCETERRMEQRANELAALPSCDARQQIIDTATTTRGLTFGLVSHDLACVACASTRKTVQDDRLYVAPGAVCCEGKVA